MGNQREFSAAMCVYGKDNPQWFCEAMDSLLAQTVCPSEIVLVVDGPIPCELGTIVSDYEQNRIIKVVWLPENRGHGEARRAAIETCTHELVALMDADDISLPTRFEKQLAVMTAESAPSIVGGNIAEFIGDATNIVAYRNLPSKGKELVAYLKKRCPFNQMTVMFKKSDVQRVGGYLDWFCNEDYYLWLRMHLAGMTFANIPEVLVNVRVGKDMYKRRGGWRYFKSEAKLQNYMRTNKIIGLPTFLMNVAKRFVVQVLLPNSLRGYVFKKFARARSAE